MEKKRFPYLNFLPLLLIVLLLSTMAGYLRPLKAMPEAIEKWKNTDQIKVEGGNYGVFRPANSAPAIGFIFYPGAKVQILAYAPLLSDLAAEGFFCALVPMPLNLAILGRDKADAVIKEHPEIKTWIIGGHSMGGAMAASYAKNHPNIAGLVLLASYLPKSDNLSNQNIRVLSVYGTLDGLATMDKVEASKKLLPPATRFTAIEGGNHAQFGWYGDQPGDHKAEISRQDQQKAVSYTPGDFLSTFYPSENENTNQQGE